MGETSAFTSGGFFLANLKIEFTHFEGDVFHREAAPLAFTGLAFEPEPLDHAVAELDARQIEHTELYPLGSFTNCFVTKLSPSFYVFLCEYHLEKYPWTDPLEGRGREAGDIRSVAERWGYYRRLIEAGDNGPLGVVAAKELTIGTSDLSGATKQWQRLLDPVESDSSGRWHLGKGPVIRLVEHSSDGVLSLKLSVSSLQEASKHLEKVGALGNASETEVAIDPDAAWGLNLRLVPETDWSK